MSNENDNNEKRPPLWNRQYNNDISLRFSTVVDVPFTPVAGHLPDDALASEFAVNSRIETFAAVIDAQAYAAFPAEAPFMFLANCQGIALRVVSAFHLHPLAIFYHDRPAPASSLR